MGLGEVPEGVREIRTVIGIIAALPHEAATLGKKVKGKKKIITLSEHALLVVSGVGKQNAHEAANILAPKVSRFISWGTAAGLVEDLHAGALVIPKLIRDQHGRSISTDHDFGREVEKAMGSGIGIHEGLLAESSQMLSGPKEKKKFQLTTQAIAADMESASVASFAQRAGLPFNAIRAVIDNHTMAVPKAISQAITKEGDINVTKLISLLLFQPSEWKRFYLLSSAFGRAQSTLHNASRALLSLASQG